MVFCTCAASSPHRRPLQVLHQSIASEPERLLVICEALRERVHVNPRPRGVLRRGVSEAAQHTENNKRRGYCSRLRLFYAREPHSSELLMPCAMKDHYIDERRVASSRALAAAGAWDGA